MWQDHLMMVVGYVFGFALLPSVLGKNKPERWTCLMTFMGLVAIAVAVGSLGLWLTFIANIFTAIMWLVVLVQKR